MNFNKFKNMLLYILLSFLLFPIIVKANIICNDGTRSPSCSDCHRGCCSHHGGCSEGLSENIYDKELENINNNDKYNQKTSNKKNNLTSNEGGNTKKEDTNYELINVGVLGILGYLIYKSKVGKNN